MVVNRIKSQVRLTLNVKGVKRVKSDSGKSYLVGDATLIVPGVLDGSRGPLYYPAEENARNPEAWNGMLVVLEHPTDIDPTTNEVLALSARDPDIFLKSCMGHNFRTSVRESDNALISQVWFDEQDTKRISPLVYGKLLRDEPVELSTGLDLEEEEAPEGSAYNGVAYRAIARNYDPDHIAILQDQLGACSNDDGCGINVNKANNKSRSKVSVINCKHKGPCSCDERGSIVKNRKKVVAVLVANCKGGAKSQPKERALLSKLSDAQLEFRALNLLQRAAYNQLFINEENQEEDVAGVDIKALAEFLGVEVDPASDPSGFINAVKDKLMVVMDKLGGPPTAPSPEPPADASANTDDANTDNMVDPPQGPEEKPRSVSTTGNKSKKQTMDEWFSTAPEEIKETYEVSKGIVDSAKSRLVDRIINSSAGDDNAKKKQRTFLEKKSLGELQTISSLLPTRNSGPVDDDDDDDDDGDDVVNNSTINFADLFGDTVVNKGNPKGKKASYDEEPLPLPVMEFEPRTSRAQH